MATIDLTQAENLALALLRNTPSEIAKVSRPDGTIGLDELHGYYYMLARKLEMAQVRRRKEYIDVNKESS